MNKQDCKVFVGGLSWETTDEKLRLYFENYGAVKEAFVSYDRHTGRPRGFGFVVFEDPAVAERVVSLQHTIDRREVEAKKAVPRDNYFAQCQPNGISQHRSRKIFVGGLAPTVDQTAFRRYFEQFGPVEDAVVMYDHENKRPRGFGFVTFLKDESVDAAFSRGAVQQLHDKRIEIKRAVPRDQMPAPGRPSPMGRLAGQGVADLLQAPAGAQYMQPAYQPYLPQQTGYPPHYLQPAAPAPYARDSTAQIPAPHFNTYNTAPTSLPQSATSLASALQTGNFTPFGAPAAQTALFQDANFAKYNVTANANSRAASYAQNGTNWQPGQPSTSPFAALHVQTDNSRQEPVMGAIAADTSLNMSALSAALPDFGLASKLSNTEAAYPRNAGTNWNG